MTIVDKVLRWHDGDGVSRSQDEVWDLLKKYAINDNTVVFSVGTDSNPAGLGYKFITSICAVKPTRGGIFFTCMELSPQDKFKGNSKARLFEEVSKSISVAIQLQQQLAVVPEVHVDAGNPLLSSTFSSEFGEQLRGYVHGFNFPCRLKPDGYASSSVSDKFSRA
jgi:predicted RNase H-related nuclease YkuK (DUF458 family)